MALQRQLRNKDGSRKKGRVREEAQSKQGEGVGKDIKYTSHAEKVGDKDRW